MRLLLVMLISVSILAGCQSMERTDVPLMDESENETIENNVLPIVNYGELDEINQITINDFNESCFAYAFLAGRYGGLNLSAERIEGIHQGEVLVDFNSAVSSEYVDDVLQYYNLTYSSSSLGTLRVDVPPGEELVWACRLELVTGVTWSRVGFSGKTL